MPGDAVRIDVALGPNNVGGLTLSQALVWTADNPALDIGGSCPANDQRHLAAPVDSPDADGDAQCDAGSVEQSAPSLLQVFVSGGAEPVVPVAVGAAGGAFAYTVTIANVSDVPQTQDVWSRAVGPDGTVSDTHFGPQPTTFGRGLSYRKTLTVRLAGPPGLYRLEFFVGTFATRTVLGSDARAVNKVGRG